MVCVSYSRWLGWSVIVAFPVILIRVLEIRLLIDFSLTVKAATLIFISGRASAISSAK